MIKTVSKMMKCSPKFMGDGAALAGFELGPGHDGDEVIIINIIVIIKVIIISIIDLSLGQAMMENLRWR